MKRATRFIGNYYACYDWIVPNFILWEIYDMEEKPYSILQSFSMNFLEVSDGDSNTD